MTGYSDPLRGEERSMNPEYAQRQMRDPGLRMMRPHIGGGLKPPGGMGGGMSLHHTMPHLQRHSGMPHFESGGLKAGAAAANQAPPQGGDPQDLQSPEEDMSPQEQQQKQIVLNAMAALDGQSPNPEADLKAFIAAFGARALADLQQRVEQHHQEQAQGGGEEEEDEGEEGSQGAPQGEPGEDQDEEEEGASDLAGAGGGLLHGRGTGQSDEIEGTTPSGRPVLLSDGEYVIDAPTVAALGDGSTKAGARRLDDFRKQIRKNAYGHDKQAKPMKAAKGGVTVTLK